GRVELPHEVRARAEHVACAVGSHAARDAEDLPDLLAEPGRELRDPGVGRVPRPFPPGAEIDASEAREQDIALPIDSDAVEVDGKRKTARAQGAQGKRKSKVFPLRPCALAVFFCISTGS